MRIGVVSDTHGNLAATQAAVAQLKDLRVDAVIHCGDIGTVPIVRLFAAWPAHFVLGNVDDDASAIRWAVEEQGSEFHGRAAKITLQDRQIAVIHGDNHAALQGAIHSGEYDLVCTGHTHRQALQRVGRTLVLNPGALHRANPRSFAVVEWPVGDVQFIELLMSGTNR